MQRFGLIGFLGAAVLFAAQTAGATAPTFICMTGRCHPSFSTEQYVHGPIASGMCPLCHDEGREGRDLPPGHPGSRVGTASDKCLLCHEEIQALMGLGSVHTPVADGDCIDCHDPHQGDNPFFLHDAPRVMSGRRIVANTCRACHEVESSDWFDDFHAGEAILDCVVCHNAHASSERFQLTRYVREVFLRTLLMDAAEFRDKGKMEDAAAAYDKALTVFPDDIDTALLLAEVYASMGEWSKAGGVYESALSYHPANIEAIVGASEAAEQREEYSAALNYMTKALEIAPDRADLHHRAGMIYKVHGKTQEAVAEFYRAVKLDPDLAPAYLNLAEILETMGMTNDARDARERYELLQGKR